MHKQTRTRCIDQLTGSKGHCKKWKAFRISSCICIDMTNDEWNQSHGTSGGMTTATNKKRYQPQHLTTINAVLATAETVALFGATGRTGSEFLKLALEEEGYAVKPRLTSKLIQVKFVLLCSERRLGRPSQRTSQLSIEKQ